MEVFLGTICGFGFNFAPRGWAFCNGGILSITSNTALFSLLGTYYGGNGTSTFALPNLQGRAALDFGSNPQSTYSMGEITGSDTTTVLNSNMPAHIHSIGMTLNANSGGRTPASDMSPANDFPAPSDNVVNDYSSTASGGVFMQPVSVALGNNGGSLPISISDPSLVINYCIAVQGIYPSRN